MLQPAGLQGSFSVSGLHFSWKKKRKVSFEREGGSFCFFLVCFTSDGAAKSFLVEIKSVHGHLTLKVMIMGNKLSKT